MGDKEGEQRNQAKSPSKAKNTVYLITKIIIGVAFILFIYKAIAHKFGW